MLKHGAATQSKVTVTELMLKHGAATQSEVAYAETWSCYTVRGRICRNTELLHSSRMQMLKNGAGTQLRMLKHTVIVSSQNRHSQSAIHEAEQPVNCDAETTSATMRRSCYTNHNSNTSISSCISIRLRENRTSYADLERRSDLV
jgi:hypothetical protein